MMNRIKNTLSFPLHVLEILWSIRLQRAFITSELDPIIAGFQSVDNSVLSPADLKKIRLYYGNAVPSILGHGFSILRGAKLSLKERRALTFLGAATGVYDDFFDDDHTPTHHIEALTLNPSKAIALNQREHFFVKCFSIALDNCISRDNLTNRALNVYRAQVQSLSQARSTLSEETIQSITLNKGGVSLLFYREVLENPMNPEEAELLNVIGGLMQLENDIFDTYKDREAGIQTLPTTTLKIGPLRQLYQALHSQVLDALNKTSFKRSNKVHFFQYINLIIYRGTVCLDFLEQQEKFTEGVFDLKEYERSQLICDMEKPSNLFRVFQYYVNSPVGNIHD